jgi:ADP-ribosyl-[dinitrogen reductase] hydrolase
VPGLADRLAGGLTGLLEGDALGVPYEFHAPEQLPSLAEIEFVPPPAFRRAHDGTPPGTWSDDGAQALALLASLLECETLDLSDFARRLLAWADHGEYAVDRRVFDIGGQTSRAFSRLRAGVAPAQAGPNGEWDNGNGSLMRVLPLALWHTGSDAALVADAQRQSLPTHSHPRSQVCCALYCMWARRVLEDAADPWREAAATLRGLYSPTSHERAELEDHIRPDEPAAGKGSGYVVDCLHSARLAIEAGAYEDVVKAAVALGNDTDTTACVAGGIAGLRDGVEAIPHRWREALRGQDIVAPLLQKLLALRGATT